MCSQQKYSEFIWLFFLFCLGKYIWYHFLTFPLYLFLKLSSSSVASCSSSFFLPFSSFTSPCLFLHPYALFTYTAAELETKNAFQSYKLLPGRLLYFSDPPRRPNNKTISQYNSQFSITSPQSLKSTRTTDQVGDGKVCEFYKHSFPYIFFLYNVTCLQLCRQVSNQVYK